MAKSCVYVPRKGKDTFLKLRKSFDYNMSKDIFLRAINPKFLEDYKGKLELDADGIPTYESLMKNPYMKKHIGERRISSAIEKNFSVLEDTKDNYYSQLDAAFNFNSSNPLNDEHVALVVNDNGKLKISIVPKTEGNLQTFKQQYGGYKLNQRLEAIFRPIGITIGTLEDYEVKAGRVGKIDFSGAKNAANELSSMIKVANNQEGAVAISEEFSHLLIGTQLDNPLVSRSIDVLSKNKEAMRQVLGDEYDDTVAFHNGDMISVAEEAVGQILRNKLAKQEIGGKEVHKHNNLFNRLVAFFKNLFRRFNEDDVTKAVNDTEFYMSRFARNIMNGSISVSKEDVVKSQRDKVFNALSDRIERNIEILKKAARTEMKRGKITHREKKAVEDEVQTILGYANSKADTVKGLMNYCLSAVNELKKYSDGFDVFETLPMETKFKFLRNVKTLIKSYGSFLQEMVDAINEENEEADNMFTKVFTINGQDIDIPSMIKEVNNISQMLERKYATTAIPMFVEFLKPFWGEDLIIPFGKNKGKKITLEDLVRHADKDISFTDRWLDSMSASSDLLLQMFDAVVKKAKDNTRLNFIDDSRKVIALRQKAERYGITDFEWMFEKDNEGHKTGNYISPVNQGQFEKDMEEFENKLIAKYGQNPKGQAAANMLTERDQWYSSHSSGVLFGQALPNETLYHNKAYDNLSSRQKEIYEEFLELKEKTDKAYPPNRTNKYKAIQQRRGSAQRILDSLSNPSTLIDNIKQSIKNDFAVMEDDDTLFGENAIKKSIADFEGNEVMNLPVLYTTRLKNPDELSNDVFASLMAYTYAGDSYAQMEKIVDPLEVGRDIVRNYRETDETSGGRSLIEKIRVGGIETISPVKKRRTNIEARLDDFFESQIYGKYLKDGGTFDAFGIKVNVNKLTSWLLAKSSLAQLGFNFLANTANAVTGIGMQNIEAACNQFFTPSMLAKADKEYASAMKDFLSDIGSRQKKSKLALFDLLFNVRQNFKDSTTKAQAKSLFRRMFGDNIAFIGQDSGDHWLYNRTAIAMALAEEVYVDGKKTNLWEALKVQKDKNGIEFIEYKNIRDRNGKPFDISAFSRKVASVNQSLFGVYNEEDQNAASRVAMGRLLQQYRKWIKPQFNKRFEAMQYNYATKSFEEGYYRTFFRFVLNNINDFRRGQIQIAQSWNSLTDIEKSNIRRGLVEYLQFAAIYALATFIKWPDDKETPWALKYAEYASKRASHELGGLTPSFTFFKENLKTIKTPIPIISVIQSCIDLTSSMFTPEDYFDEIQSGPYKGMSTLEKNFIKAPIPGITQVRQISKFTGDIDNSIQYYMRPSF